MDTTERAEPASGDEGDKKYLTVRQAAFIGVGAMVGAGIFALLGAAGATNAGLYPAQGMSERLAETGQFPPLMARKLGGRVSDGLLIQAAACLVLAVAFKLDSIASIGSAVALVIFTMITAAHLRTAPRPAPAFPSSSWPSWPPARSS